MPTRDIYIDHLRIALSALAVIFHLATQLGMLIALPPVVAGAYAVYLIHTPVTVAIGYALSGLAVHPLVKWLVASLVAVPSCFAIAHLILRRIPPLKQLLFGRTSS